MIYTNYSNYLTEEERGELLKKTSLTIWEFKILFNASNTATVIRFSDYSQDMALFYGLEHLDNGEINLQALLIGLGIPNDENSLEMLERKVESYE